MINYIYQHAHVHFQGCVMSQNVTVDKKNLEEILLTCQQIDKEVSPILGMTSLTVEKINSLKNMEFSVPLLGKQSAWKAVTTTFPGIGMVEGHLGSLNNQLSEWKNAAASVSEHLPRVISTIEQTGGAITNTQLQEEIDISLSAFGTLKKKTDQIHTILTPICMALDGAESGVKKATKIPFLGQRIDPVAQSLEKMHTQVEALKEKTADFSQNIGEQSQKLSSA
jgi:hypothetical protein